MTILVLSILNGSSSFLHTITGMRKFLIDQDFLIEHWHMICIMPMKIWLKLSFNIVELILS